MLDRRTLVWPDRSEKGGVKSRSQTNIGAFLDHIGARLAFNELACGTVIRRAGRETLLTDEAAKGLWLEADALGLESSDSYFLAVLGAPGPAKRLPSGSRLPERPANGTASNAWTHGFPPSSMPKTPN